MLGSLYEIYYYIDALIKNSDENVYFSYFEKRTRIASGCASGRVGMDENYRTSKRNKNRAFYLKFGEQNVKNGKCILRIWFSDRPK